MGNKEIRAKDAWHSKLEKHEENIKSEGSTYSYGDEEIRLNRGGNKFKRFKKPGKAIMIFGSIVAGLILIALLFKLVGFNTDDGISREAAHVKDNHIGVLYIEGTIGQDSDTYNQQYILDAIDGMMKNSSNKGMMLYVNTPGGGVYESDEIYFKIKEYQKKTGRPVYSYMASQATSGGYYISAPADKIIANRNCWTGSIGVTMGTLFDISGLLEKHGIKSETITSGANKSMGSFTEPLTDEQRLIMQGMIDEAYDQFVGIVAEGRNLDENYVRSISDGRIYTAHQAKNIKLIDDVVNTYEDAVNQMKTACSMEDCDMHDFRYHKEPSFLDSMVKGVDELAKAMNGRSDISAITELMERQAQLPLQYMCEVKK